MIAPLRSPMAASAARLDIQVDSQFEALTRYRRLAAQQAYFAAMTVDDHVLRTIGAAEQRIVFLLNA